MGGRGVVVSDVSAEWASLHLIRERLPSHQPPGLSLKGGGLTTFCVATTLAAFVTNTVVTIC